MNSTTHAGFALRALTYRHASAADRFQAGVKADCVALAKDIALAAVLAIAVFGAMACVLFAAFQV